MPKYNPSDGEEVIDVYLDPTHLTPKQAFLLGQVLRASKQVPAEEFTEVHLLYENPKRKRQRLFRIHSTHEIVQTSDEISHVLLEEVGQGGQNKVYRRGTLVHQPNGSVVYKRTSQHIHFIKKSKQAYPEAVINHFSWLADRTKHLHSKVTAVPVEENDKKHFVYNSMLKMPGETLFDVLAKNKPFSPALCFELTRKLLQAIAEQAHQVGVLHNDLKPQNIIVDIDSENQIVRAVNIIDTEHGTDIKEGKVKLGTIKYASPEAFSSPPVAASDKSDVFPTGLMVGMIWCNDTNALLRKVENSKLETFSPLFHVDTLGLDSGASAAIEKQLQQMTRLDPESRCDFQSAITFFENMEYQYAATNIPKEERNNFQLAHNKGKETRTDLQALIAGYATSGSLKSYIENASSILHKALDSINEVEIDKDSSDEVEMYRTVKEFTKMLDVNAFRSFNNILDLHKAVSNLFVQINDNLLKLARIESLDLQLKLEDKKYLLRLAKKLKKCRSLDEFNEFNTAFSHEINQLYEHYLPLNIRKKLAAADFTRLIDQAKTYEEVMGIYGKLTDDDYLFLKVERGLHGLFGKHGVTTTWGLLVEQLQAKALSLAKTEKQDFTLTDINIRYGTIFTEKAQRVGENQYQKKFWNLVNNNQPRKRWL